MNIIELFAGVGGFRLGFEKFDNKIVWSNQWEPSTKVQHASDIYVKNFGDEGHSNEDINTVDAKDIPKHDILCGGFPCQNYSVATAGSGNKFDDSNHGIRGEKGVLWWEIHRIIIEHKTPYLFLENVDRLIKSSAKQIGKDFAIILKSLMDLDYTVEWQVINAADYGFPQKRRRTFIFAYKNNSPLAKKLFNNNLKEDIHNSILSQSFDFEQTEQFNNWTLEGDIFSISDNFNKDNKNKNPFYKKGIARNNEIYSFNYNPVFNGNYETIKNILVDESIIEEEFFVKGEEAISKWKWFKDKRETPRVNKASGTKYIYKQGSMDFPDSIDKPSRTIITSEGGKSASRTTHVIKPENNLRRLHPIELERLNGFPDNHTEGVSNTKRGFLMGNALIVGIVEKVAETLNKNLK